MSYEHHTGDLVQAISCLEAYPQFGGMVPKLKKELAERFKGIKTSKKGIKNCEGVKYHSSGLVDYNISSGWNQAYARTTLDPFDFEIPEAIPIKDKLTTSRTRSAIIERLKNGSNFYNYLAYNSIDLKMSKRYMLLDRITLGYQALQKVANEKIPDNIKSQLMKDLFTKLRKRFPGNPYHYGHSGKNKTPEEMMKEYDWALCGFLKERMFNYSHHILKNGDRYYNYNSQKNEKPTFSTKYALKMYFPTKAFLNQWVSHGDAGGYGKDHKSSESYIFFNTFLEMVAGIKQHVLSVNKNNVGGLKMFGFDVSDEMKKIKKTKKAKKK